MTSHRSSMIQGPDDRDLSDVIKPGWNRHMSLQEASSSLTQLARYDVGVVAELPEESSLRIEINGILAGVAHCLPDAPSELALGWALMHGFFGVNDPIDTVTVHDDRVSLMIESGRDIDQWRLRAVGWRGDAQEPDTQSGRRASPFAIHAAVLVGLVREAIRVMAKDRSRDGFVHAALASDTTILCVARDHTVEMAVAKVFGWLVREGQGQEVPILIVRGMVDRAVVATAGQLGVSMVVATGIPTADAFREATGREMSILGMAANQRPGLLVDAGHVVEGDNPP